MVVTCQVSKPFCVSTRRAPDDEGPPDIRSTSRAVRALRGRQQSVPDHGNAAKGLGNELVAPKTTSIGIGPVRCRAWLGGELKFYYREAA
jgi:hypothetical protein